MVDENLETQMLRKLRLERVIKRRLLLQKVDKAEDKDNLVDQLVAIQLQVEAIDRAIDDEVKIFREHNRGGSGIRVTD